MIIEYGRLSSEILKNIVTEFILREGTNYGSSDFSLEQKVEQVLTQIKEKKVFLLYDKELDSCNLVTKRDLENHKS